MNVQEQLLRQKIDPYLADRQLGDICSEVLGQKTKVGGYEILTGGCWNRVIGVETGGPRLVIKISPHATDDKIIREFRVLEEFRKSTALPVPEPLLLDAESRFTPGTMLVMSRIPGVVMHQCFGMFGGPDRTRITGEIAEHVAALHQIRSTGFGGVEVENVDRYNNWADFWLPRFDKVIRDVADVAPRHLVDGALAVRPEFAAALDIGEESTMTHYDIWSGNVMINLPDDPPHVSGFIDIPGHFADYARELSFAMMFGVADSHFFHVYKQHHEIDDGFELRASIYNLKMNLRHVQMYPHEHFYQQGAAECLATIEQYLGS